MKHYNSSIKLAGLFTLAALALIQGCGDDNANDKPDTTIPIDTGGTASGGKASSGGGKTNSGGGKAGSGTTAGPDAGAPGDGGTGAGTGATGTGATGPVAGDAGAANEGGSGNIVEPPTCALPALGTNGCFNCPTDRVNEEWLNRCVSGVKYTNTFDNATRVPRLPADGKLDFAHGN